MAAKKLTKLQLELEEKKLDILERRAFLKQEKELICIRREELSLQKLDQLRWALESSRVEEGVFAGEPKTRPIIDEIDYNILLKKYLKLLKEL